MAPSATIGSLTDELVASLIPGSTVSSKARKLKDNFIRHLRHHNYARTNQFEVAERLDGLQEKFLVLNHEELADALRARLRELEAASLSPEKWLPDILHLLLQLSDDPLQKTNWDGFAKYQTSDTATQPLRWAEVEVEDPIDRKSQVWENPNFSDLSSDEDTFIVASKPSSPSASRKDERVEEVLREQTYLVRRDSASDDDCLSSRKHIWTAPDESVTIITELQALREALFMLQGLPTTLFWRVDRKIEVDKRFRLNHITFHLLSEILDSFASVGLRVDLIRSWLGKPQNLPFMQSLRAGIEQKILDFDACISQMQQRLLTPVQLTLVSVGSALEEITKCSSIIMPLASFLEKLTSPHTDGVEYLDLLYNTVCGCQASGKDDLLEPLGQLFVKAFEVFLKPVLRWIDFGEVDSSLKSIFMDNTIQGKSLPDLWHSWYKLKDHFDPNETPQFMQPLMHTIFITGKMKVFLRHLPNTRQDLNQGMAAQAIAEIRSVQISGLLPFSSVFESIVKNSIEIPHKSSSAQLRKKLTQDCGLWQTLEALHSIFLGKSGWALDAIDSRIFDRIDQGNPAWNDRYILTELYRNAFQGIEVVDTKGIVLHIDQSSSRDVQSQRRSVKMLENITLAYTLPWPVANIVSEEALHSYRLISTFLFQIRRARYVLERRCRLAVATGRRDITLFERLLAQKIQFQLLMFLNYLYDYLTMFAIERATNEMRQALTAAIDVDGMIQVHQSYMSKLEEMCLVSRRVSTIKKPVMIVLDLCIRFSDAATSPVGRKSSLDAQSFKSVTSHHRYRRHRQSSGGSSSDEESSGSEGFSTFITFDESSYEGNLRHIKQEFDSQRSFILAGLKSISRVEEQNTGWDVLAERLDWDISMKR